MIDNIPLTPVKTLIQTMSKVNVKNEFFHIIDMEILKQRTANKLKNTDNDNLLKINILHTQNKDNMLHIYNDLICKKKIIDPLTFGSIIDQFTKFMYKVETMADPTPENIMNMINKSNAFVLTRLISDDNTNELIDQLIFNIANDATAYKTAENPYAKLNELIAETYFFTIIENQIKSNKYSNHEFSNELANATKYMNNIFENYPDIAWLTNMLSFITYLYLTSFNDKFDCDYGVNCEYKLAIDTPTEKNISVKDVISGETDFSNETKIIDLKVSKNLFTPDHLMQVGLYYLLSPNKATVTELSLYNPLLNQSIIVSPSAILKINDIGTVIEKTAKAYLEKQYE